MARGIVILYPRDRRLDARLLAVVLESVGYRVVLSEGGGREIRVVVGGRVVRESDLEAWLQLYDKTISQPGG